LTTLVKSIFNFCLSTAVLVRCVIGY
jgi:hypothetical protein